VSVLIPTGCAMLALLAFGFSPDQASPPLLAAFGVTTALTLCINTYAMTMTEIIRASILKSGSSLVSKVGQVGSKYPIVHFK
jgi:hypothetical protein